jgi:ABC-type Mn2+/Zn2+ transport system ATPase subunit
MSLVTFTNVALGYGRTRVVSNLSFTIDRGDFLGIVGPNGSGKTTIVRAILGSIKPLAGRIARGSPDGRVARIGYVPQRETINSIMPYTVWDVALMGRYRMIGVFGRASARDDEAVGEALRHVDAEGFAQNSFRDLSGGQKQRALIARALAGQPDVLVLDEPTNGMDLTSRSAILELIKRLHKDDGLTIIMVSHLLSDVANYVQRIAMVEKGSFQIGSTEEILTSENLSRLYGMRVEVTVAGHQKLITPVTPR